jgi:hypothetical protein
MPLFFMFKNLGVRVAHLRCATLLLLFAAKVRTFRINHKNLNRWIGVKYSI